MSKPFPCPCILVSHFSKEKKVVYLSIVQIRSQRFNCFIYINKFSFNFATQSINLVMDFFFLTPQDLLIQAAKNTSKHNLK